MIGATVTFAPARLAQRAAALAEAHAETVLRKHRSDPWRWRAANLLWPLFSRNR